MKLVVAAVAILALSSPVAAAYQVPATPFDQGSGTMPGSALTQTISTTGKTMVGSTTTAGARGLTGTTYAPDLASDTPAQEIVVRTGDCASVGPCPNRGTVTIAFSQPVRNPLLHIAGMGGVSSESAGGHIRRQSELHSVLKLTTSGVTLSKASTGNNFAVAGGDTVTAVEDDTGPTCPTTSTGSGPPAKASAVCGSVLVNGTVMSLTFSVTAVFTKNASLPAHNQSTSGDAVSIVASVREDFGDAPASYDAGNAARSVIGDVELGAAVSEDNKDVANSNSSPNTSGDSDDDGVTLTPLTSTATSYSAAVKISGASKSGRVCGWIDFDKSGKFESDERACAAVTAGQTSATLNWTGLSGLTAGSTYARFRVGYTAAQVRSPAGASDSGEVEDYPFTITPPEPPTAMPDTGSTPQDVDITVNPLANDKPGAGATLDPSTVCLVSGSDCLKSLTVNGEGAYTVNSNGTVTFDPVPELTGTAGPVTYRVADSNGRTATSTITVTVTPIKPEVRNDTGNTAYDTSVTTAVLSNDTPGHPSAPLIPASVCIVTGGACVKTHTVAGEGSYQVGQDGRIAFDPVQGFTGKTMPITYWVADDNGSTGTATLTITVAPPPPPTAAPDIGTTEQNVDVTVNPLSNDKAGAPGVTLDPATVCLVSASTCVKSRTVPGQGAYTVDAKTGMVTFDPLPTFTGTASPVGYRVSDSTGQAAGSTITITVTPVVPQAVADSHTTPFGTPAIIPVLGNDKPGSPAAPLDPASVCLVSGTACVKTLAVRDQGTYAVRTDGSIVFDPEDGFRGVATPVGYRVADGNGTTAEATLTVTVGEPPVAKPDSITTGQNVTVTIDPLANDKPGTGGTLDPKSVEVFDSVTKSWVKTVTVPGEGTYTVRTSGRVEFDPVPGFTRQSSVPYRVTDSYGNSAASTITITVLPAVPQAIDDTGNTAYATPITVPVLANDKPGAPGVPLDPATVCLVSESTCLKTLTAPSQGIYAVRPDGSVRFVPVNGYRVAATPVTYEVRDVNGTPARARLTITVMHPEGARAKPDSGSGRPRQPVVIDPLANDRPSNGARWQRETICLGTACVKQLVIPGVGTWKAGKEVIWFVSDPDLRGTVRVPYRVTDTFGITVHSVVRVRITEKPTPPGDDELPDTGGPLLPLLIAGLLLVGTGGAIVAVARRQGSRRQ